MEEQMIKLIAGVIMMGRMFIQGFVLLIILQGGIYQLSGKRINLYKMIEKKLEEDF